MFLRIFPRVLLLLVLRQVGSIVRPEALARLHEWLERTVECSGCDQKHLQHDTAETTLRHQFAVAQAACKRLETENGRLQAQVTDLQQSLTEKTADLALHEESIRLLNNDLVERDQKIVTLQNQFDELHNKHMLLDQDHVTLSMSINVLLDRHSCCREERKELQAERDCLVARLERLEQERDILRLEYTALNDELETMTEVTTPIR